MYAVIFYDTALFMVVQPRRGRRRVRLDPSIIDYHV